MQKIITLNSSMKVPLKIDIFSLFEIEVIKVIEQQT